MLDIAKETTFILKHIERLTPEQLHEELVEAGLEVYSESANWIGETEISCEFRSEEHYAGSHLVHYEKAPEVKFVSYAHDVSDSNPAA
jgi:hypothetical protein